ncbi:hypothetical protein LXA43DRAFT_1130055 [Ganoderma leucocontextum]|nr:hypothetical protein LXA43DRAFT_1130055 [Ganoderma leucocontextum]
MRALGNDQHELTFANGFTTTCDFLVGADGANSRVRSLVSPATAVYLGVNGAEISLGPETTKLSAVAETIANIGKGTMMAKDVLKAYFAGWPEWMLNLIGHCDESAIYPCALWTLPIRHTSLA